jgi:hypothetical protein
MASKYIYTKHSNLQVSGSPSYMYNYIIFTMGFSLGVLHSPPPYLCIVLGALYTYVQKNFTNLQKDVGILPA